MVSSDRITRRFIGGVIILTTLFFTVGLSWNFWFIEEPLPQKDVDGTSLSVYYWAFCGTIVPRHLSRLMNSSVTPLTTKLFPLWTLL